MRASGAKPEERCSRFIGAIFQPAPIPPATTNSANARSGSRGPSPEPPSGNRDLTSWEVAQRIVRDWKANGRIGQIEAPSPPSPKQSRCSRPRVPERCRLRVTSTRERRAAGESGISPTPAQGASLRCKRSAYLPIRDFRASWPDAPLSASKKLERLRSTRATQDVIEMAKSGSILSTSVEWQLFVVDCACQRGRGATKTLLGQVPFCHLTLLSLGGCRSGVTKRPASTPSGLDVPS